MNQEIKEQLDSLFSVWKNGLCPGGQVLIRQNGKTIYEECFGFGNLENRLKITNESIFHVASISKQFTVLAALLLWKEGKLELDAPITRYLEEYINIKEPVTVRQMLNNVSGLRDQWELLFLRGITINDKIDMEDINTTIRLQKRLNFTPQSAYLYSNTGFHLLSLIVEKLSKMSFPQFVSENIFKPLGMEHTVIRQSFTQIIPNLVYSYQDDGDGSYYYNPLNYAVYGPTSVNTCASDLSRMLDEYIRPNHIDPDIIALMKTPAVLSDGTEAEYCGGLMKHKLHGLDVFGHGGADAAYRGQVSVIPEKELEIIILSNTTGRVISKLADKAACIVLGLPDCTEPTVPEHTSKKAREGLFVTAAPADPVFVSIKEDNGSFYMKKEWGSTRLTEEPDGGWRVGTLDEVLYFTEEGILYRLPGQVISLTPAMPAAPGAFVPGHYYGEETDTHMELKETAGGYEISMLRYGRTPVCRNGSGNHAFSFGPDLSMYIRQEGASLVLDGGRIRHITLEKISFLDQSHAL